MVHEIAHMLLNTAIVGHAVRFKKQVFGTIWYCVIPDCLDYLPRQRPKGFLSSTFLYLAISEYAIVHALD